MKKVQIVAGKILALALITQTDTASSFQRIPVDPIRVGAKIPTMNEYKPEPGYGYPTEFRVTDCWQCFQAQGKVCMEKSHGHLFDHMETTKKSGVFCCKPDYNEGYCKNGATHGPNDDTQVEMICSPPSFVGNPASSPYSNVLTGQRNHQLFAYCP